MKGRVTEPEIEFAGREENGVEVYRMTSAPSINHSTYFLQCPLTPDGRTMLFTSYRGGAAQLYSVEEFPHGPVRQWTSGEPIHPFSAAIHPDGERVFFVRGGEVWEILRGTLAERLVARLEGGQLGELSLGQNGEWIAAAARQNGRCGIAVGRAGGSGWRLIEFPRTVIHPQFHPLEPEWIEFAGDPAPRMHRVRRDGTGLECLYEHGNDEFVVHETFLGRTGDLVYTVWPHSLWRMNWGTRERTKICDFNAWHITPDRAGARILCDTNHPDLGLFLIDAATGARRKVCEAGASNRGSQWKLSRYALAEDFARAQSEFGRGALSWMETAADTVYGPQWTHPHPSFTRDERGVIFTSDREGHPHVYWAKLHEGF